MERHKLWNARAERLMNKTFESWSKKKKKVYEDEEWGYDEEGNSLNPEDQGDVQIEQGWDVITTALSRFLMSKLEGTVEDPRDLKYVERQIEVPLHDMVKGLEGDVIELLLKSLGHSSAEEVQEMTGGEEYKEPEVQKAAEKAKTAKIDSVKAQLKALQNQG